MGASEKRDAALHPGGAVTPPTTEHSPQAVAARTDYANRVPGDPTTQSDAFLAGWAGGRAEARAEKRTTNREALIEAALAGMLDTKSASTPALTMFTSRDQHDVADARALAGQAVDAIFDMPDSPLIADREAITYASPATLRFIESFNGDEAGDIDEVGSVLGDLGYAMRGGNDVAVVLQKAFDALFESGVIREYPKPPTFEDANDASAELLVMAEAWHEVSDHRRDGVPFGGPLCNCERVARRAANIGWRPSKSSTLPEGGEEL